MKLKEYVMQLQEKLDISLDYIERVANLNTRFVESLPKEYKEEFIQMSQTYISRYREYLEDLDYGKEEK